MSLTGQDLAVIQAMIDAAAAPGVGEGFPQPIVAGQQLLIPGIQSPNFSLAGQAGWQILKSGLATFFGVVLSGGTVTGPDYIINSAGAFFYSGTPAAGNLAVSIASTGGADQFGNGYGPGITSFGALGAAAQITSAAVGLFSGLNIITAITSAGFFLYSPAGGAGNLAASAAPAAGTDSYGNAYLAGNVSYGTDGASWYAVAVQGFAGKGPGVVFYTAASEAGPWTQGPALYAGGAGAVRELSAGNNQDQVLVRGSTDSLARTNANSTALVTVTATYTIQAGEAQLISIYELFFAGHGQWNVTTGQTLQFTLLMDGAVQLGTISIGAAGGIPANAHFAVEGRYRISVVTTGAGGTMNVTGSVYLSDTDGNRQSSQSILGNTNVTGKAIDTTAAHQFAVQCAWGAGGTTQTITITDSDWTKKGN